LGSEMAENRLKSRREKKGVKMRLNRVLQNKLNRVSLLATISMAMAAATFTISCGEDGSNGKDGADCIVTGSAAPYQIFCGGQPVGTLNDGSKGPTGNPSSNPGIPGAQGKSCLVNQSGSTWEVVCGTEVMGTLSGCSVVQNAVDNPKDFTINCGETVVNMCNNAVLEEGMFCDDEGNQGNVLECGVDKTPYIYTKQYCGFENAAAVTAGTPKVMPLCGINKGPDDIAAKIGFVDDFNGPNEAEAITDSYGDTTGWVLTVNSGCKTSGTEGTRCRTNSVMDVTVNGITYTVTNPDSVRLRSWQNEYCEVNRTTDDNGWTYYFNEDNSATESTKPIKTGKTIDRYYVQKPLDNDCDSILNKDAWKGEYCGYNTNGVAKLNDACSNGGRPNETSVTEKYCAKGDAKAKLSQVSEEYCTPVYTVYLNAAREMQKTPVGAKVPLNRIQGKPNTLLTADDVADEYCGYTLLDWNKTRKSIANITNPTRARPDTAYTSVRKSKCTDGTVLDKESDYAIGLENFLKGEKKVDSDRNFVVAFPEFKNQYCQASENGTTTAVPVNAPTTLAQAYAVYCMKNPLDTIKTGDYAGMLAYSADPQTGSNANARRLNINTWAGEYCAYPTAAAFYAPTNLSSSSVAAANFDPVVLNASRTALLGNLSSRFDVGHQSGANGPSKFRTCDLKTAVTEAMSGTASAYNSAFNAPNAVFTVDTLGYWPNEYCQFKRSGFDKVVGFRIAEKFTTAGFSAAKTAYDGGSLITASGTAYGGAELFKIYCPLGDTATGTVAGRLSLDAGNVALGSAGSGDKAAFNKRYMKAYQGLLGSATGNVVAVSTLNAGGSTYAAGSNSWTVTNNTGWRNQYCGIEKSNWAVPTNDPMKKFSVITAGFCASSNGTPTTDQPNDYNVRNLTNYPEEYCQFQNATTARVVGLYNRTGASGTELTDFADFSKVYCVADTATGTVAGAPTGTLQGFGSADNKVAWYRNKNLADGQRMNKGTWAREYCQISTYPTATVAKATFTKTGSLTTAAGVCDHMGAPNEAGEERTKTFQNEYCQADETGETTRVGGIDAYCEVPGYPENPDAWRAASIGSAYRVNEGTWKGQYCFADFKLGVCLGGQVPAVNSSGGIVNSTSNPKCRIPGETT